MEFEDVDELVVATGNNLQERKRLLWETCDCVVVLPGGTGTWDELMEVRKEGGRGKMGRGDRGKEYLFYFTYFIANFFNHLFLVPIPPHQS